MNHGRIKTADRNEGWEHSVDMKAGDKDKCVKIKV